MSHRSSPRCIASRLSVSAPEAAVTFRLEDAFGTVLAETRETLSPHSVLIDFDIPSGEEIPIEVRDSVEVMGYGNERWAPEGIEIYNPAFDVTPAELVTAIVTEKGILAPPYTKAIAKLLKQR